MNEIKHPKNRQNILFTAFIVLTLLSFALLLPQWASASDSLHYAPEFCELKGKLRRQNYVIEKKTQYDVKRTQKTYWVLRLPFAASVEGRGRRWPGHEKVSTVKLILTNEQYREFRHSLNQDVMVTGQLYPDTEVAEIPVKIEVYSLKPLD